MQTSRTRTVLITLVNILSVPAAIFFAFMLFMGGAFASDSGTTTALIISFSVMGASILYPVLTVVAIVFSQKRRSILIAVLPLILPVLLFLWLMSPWFSFS